MEFAPGPKFSCSQRKASFLPASMSLSPTRSRGVSKIRFEVDAGDAGKQITDYGVTVLDTAVPIIGARM